MHATDIAHANRSLRWRCRPMLLVALVALVALGVLWGGVAQAAEAPAQPDWLISDDGAYIVHLSAKVAWPRCVEGMRWNGRGCEGQALRLSQADALALAKTRERADGVAWRLPHLKELQLLARQNARPAKSAAVFLPAYPSGWCWTATAVIDTSAINDYRYGNVMRGVTTENMARVQFMHAWAVDTATGEARKDVLKRSLLLVRLLRPL